MTSKSKLLLACLIAMGADLLQVVLLPFMIEGALSPWDDILDFVVAGALTSLLGWHWVFLPTLVGELAPVADIAPFWTVAVFYVAIRGKKPAEVEHTPTTSLKSANP